MLRSANDAAIRSAIGLGQTDAPTFLAINVGVNSFVTESGELALARYGTTWWRSGEIVPMLLRGSGALGWSSGTSQPLPSGNLFLYKDDAGILAQRNGTNAQAFRVYNTTDGTNKEYLNIGWSGNVLSIGASNEGAGVQRDLKLAANSVIVRPAGTDRWIFSNLGHLLAAADNSVDIGASGANRPRALYLAAGITAGGVISGQSYGASASGYFNWATRSQITSPSDGVIRLSNDAQNDFNRLQLGSTADTHPAIARDGAGIKFTGAAAGSTSWIKVPAVAVSALPSAATAGVGARSFVSDALTPVFGSAVTGGGAVTVPVYSTGSAWNVG